MLGPHLYPWPLLSTCGKGKKFNVCVVCALCVRAVYVCACGFLARSRMQTPKVVGLYIYDICMRVYVRARVFVLECCMCARVSVCVM